MTQYIILREDKDTEFWQEFVTQEASSPQRALRLRDVEEGTYVAIPVRSWKPMIVKTETTTKVTIG